MEISISEAADRLGVHPSRVRQMILSKDLRARQVGRFWLVDLDDVVRLASHRALRGRPLGPRRAWGILDLLGGGRAEWLSASARSQVRSSIGKYAAADVDMWRSALRGRSDVIRCRAHPAALGRLSGRPGILKSGPAEAASRGFDLVVLDEGIGQVYIGMDELPQVKRELALREADSDPNLVIRVPRLIWPFSGLDAVPDAVLAADMLEEPEPRAVSAGLARLNQLQAGFHA